MSFSGLLTDIQRLTSVRCFAARTNQIARRGVTLVEFLVVLAILAVLVGLGLPRLDSARFRADANVRLVRMALQQAQTLSAQRQHDVVVSFDLSGGRIRVLDDSDNSRSLTAGEHVAWRALTEGARFAVPAAGINGAVATAVSGSSVATLDGMPTVTFYRNGSLSSGVEVYIQVDGKKENVVRAVELVQSTGKTQSYRYTGAAWKPSR